MDQTGRAETAAAAEAAVEAAAAEGSLTVSAAGLLSGRLEGSGFAAGLPLSVW